MFAAAWPLGTCHAESDEVSYSTPPAQSTESSQGAFQDSYRLDSGDHLQVHFYDRLDRDDLNRVYIVDEEGQISLPRFGRLGVRGRRIAEVEFELRQGIEKMGEKPGSFSIEILQYRPFYVSGLANHPGSFVYTPGFTVMHAVALAGGLYRSPMAQISDALRERRELTDTLGRLGGLIAQRTRLQAELDGLDTIAAPKELLQLEPVRGPDMIKNEIAVMQGNRAVEARDRSWFQDIISVSKKDIENYQREMERVNRRIEEQAGVSQELKRLFDQKIINQQRVFEAVVALDSVQREKEVAQDGLSRSIQTLQKAEHDLDLLPLTRKSRILNDITKTEQEIGIARTRATDTKRVADGLEALAAQGGAQYVASYRIMRRRGNGQFSFIQATETTLVLPGDVVQIDSVLKETNSLF
jgi:polysaccharide export outer membrane protein/exopolysaccharide production protein ExoF